MHRSVNLKMLIIQKGLPVVVLKSKSKVPLLTLLVSLIPYRIVALQSNAVSTYIFMLYNYFQVQIYKDFSSIFFRTLIWSQPEMMRS